MIMKETVDTQKQMMREVNVDSIHDIMDEMHYIKEDQEEINEAIARSYDVEVNDEELDAGNLVFLFIIVIIIIYVKCFY